MSIDFISSRSFISIQFNSFKFIRAIIFKNLLKIEMELYRAMNGPREKNVYEVSVLTRRKSLVQHNTSIDDMNKMMQNE
jgi:hypothetical protein